MFFFSFSLLLTGHNGPEQPYLGPQHDFVHVPRSSILAQDRDLCHGECLKLCLLYGPFGCTLWICLQACLQLLLLLVESLVLIHYLFCLGLSMLLAINTFSLPTILRSSGTMPQQFEGGDPSLCSALVQPYLKCCAYS